MKLRRIPMFAALALLALPIMPAAQADQGHQSQSGQSLTSMKFPPTKTCTTNEPCRTVTGEIVRIEESYWIKQPDGSEIHVTVTPTTNIQGLPKVGDNIAAQMTSRGDAEAVVKLKSLPDPAFNAPEKTHQDLR
ncbi:MAG: hypothetical protein R3B37_02105 [Nitrospira sp.]|nr:hypothetical protein [Nitrospira sp.]